jgi:hypothetical protein
MARMAYQHGLTTKELCKMVWPSYSGNPDIDRITTDNHLQILAERTNCTFPEVSATTMAFYKHKLFRKVNLKTEKEEWIVPSKLKVNKVGNRWHDSGLMFCPKCLSRERYFKKQWRLALSFACTKCGCYLIEDCPHCHKGNSFIDTGPLNTNDKTLDELMLDCHHCGYDVTNCEPETAPDEVILLQQKLFDIMNNRLHERVVYTESYFHVLYWLGSFLLVDNDSDQKVRKFADHVSRLNGNSLAEIKPGKTELRELPVKKRATVIKLAHWLLEDWPYRFVDTCLATEIKSGKILSSVPNAPYWFWETVKHGLTPQFPADISRFIIDNEDFCTVRPKNQSLKRLDYDYNEYFYDDERYEEDGLDYINPDNMERLSLFYGIDRKRRLRYLYNREDHWN